MTCKCGAEIPEKRIELGYKECVNCSTTTAWTVVPVVYHKTGNSAQIIKDPDTAKDFLYASSRKGFGVSSGMKGNRTRIIEREASKKIIPPPPPPSNKIVSRKQPTYQFEEVGIEIMEIIEKRKDKQAAFDHIERALEQNRIYKKQATQLQNIINVL